MGPCGMGHPPRSHRAFRRLVYDEGFSLRFYENIDAHMALSYRDAAATARQRFSQQLNQMAAADVAADEADAAVAAAAVPPPRPCLAVAAAR